MSENMQNVSLKEAEVVVIGMGLMGASLAMNLKGYCHAVYGVDNDVAVLRLALNKKIVDDAFQDIASLPGRCDLLILATPVKTILRYLSLLPEQIPYPAVVLDVGSTKGKILEAMDDMPARFDVIGGHPMCGKERGGIENAEPGLFHHAPFILTPLERTSEGAMSLARQLVQQCNAVAIEIAAEAHDRMMAAISHLPYILSNALCSLTPLEVAPVIGPGFRSTARLAPTPLQMMMDVIETNASAISLSLEEYISHLQQINILIKHGEFSKLENKLMLGGKQYIQLLQLADEMRKGGEG